jgi:hypothetical protein
MLGFDTAWWGSTWDVWISCCTSCLKGQVLNPDRL